MYQSKTWLNYPGSTATPVNAPALIAMETRAANFTGANGLGPGVVSYNDYFPTVAGGLTISLAPGGCLIPLDTNGGTERYDSTVASTAVLTTADATNPRVDQVILAAPALVNGGASDSQTPTIQVLTGTPTPGATLANRSGAQALPARAIRVCDVLITAGMTTVPQANVFDRRQQPYYGTLPMPANPTGLALQDFVTMNPHPFLPLTYVSWGVAFTAYQIATPVYIPRRIVNAGHVRWQYVQSPTPMTGNWNMGLMDAGGTLIAATGSQAIVGGANTFVQSNVAIALGTVEAGWYIQFLGMQVATASSFLTYTGTFLSGAVTTPTAAQGLAYARAAGGISVPQNLSVGGVQDDYNVGSSALPGMPAMVLTV